MKRTALVVLAAAVALAAAGPAAAGYKAKIAGGTLTLTGTKKGEKVALRLKKGAPGKLQIDVGANGSAEFTFNRSAFTAIVVNAGAGNDTVTISEKNGAFTTLENTSVFGGAGKDTFTGGSGAESFVGGTGNDTANGKAGDDVFFWTVGEGSDKLDGGLGNDTSTLTGGAGQRRLHRDRERIPRAHRGVPGRPQPGRDRDGESTFRLPASTRWPCTASREPASRRSSSTSESPVSPIRTETRWSSSEPTSRT